ncbi:serine/threonine-protein kinase [Embleya sp. NPDC020886]|uniref:serine/threonine-protein kinase n=1 Tax=Embleya sp. NPDC020886 TaxID=3363980 RepID=UPI0037BCF50F
MPGGRYTLVERLGGGAMGEVWRTEDGVLERQVAVKIPLPALPADAKFAERFRREAKVPAALDHPGIVDVHDYGESGSEPRVAYIVMELVEGRPPDVVLAEGGGEGRGGAMPVDRVLGIAAQALDALHAAHLRGIVHRDVKPFHQLEAGRGPHLGRGLHQGLHGQELPDQQRFGQGPFGGFVHSREQVPAMAHPVGPARRRAARHTAHPKGATAQVE